MNLGKKSGKKWFTSKKTCLSILRLINSLTNLPLKSDSRSMIYSAATKSLANVFYYIHFEITGDPCNLIGSELCDLFPNRTTFGSKSHLFPSQWKRHTKTAQPKRFQISFKVTNQIAGKMYVIIKSGNLTSCRAILIWNHTCDFETNSRCALVQFWNHAYDFRPNCTPLSWITVINEYASHNFLGWVVLRNFFYLSDRWKVASIAISQRS